MVMRQLRSVLLAALLGALSLGLVAATPQPAQADFWRYGPYGAYWAPYYWHPRHHWPHYWTGRYFYNPYGYGWYYGSYYPLTNRYYYWYRTYPWWY
jgi:hypothetical protein